MTREDFVFAISMAVNYGIPFKHRAEWENVLDTEFPQRIDEVITPK